jgi:hypothetical protein
MLLEAAQQMREADGATTCVDVGRESSYAAAYAGR